jgi:DNA-binding response OmpR family regulator
MDLGVKEFMNKPVTVDRLIAEIEKHLGNGAGGILEPSPSDPQE